MSKLPVNPTYQLFILTCYLLWQPGVGAYGLGTDLQRNSGVKTKLQ